MNGFADRHAKHRFIVAIEALRLAGREQRPAVELKRLQHGGAVRALFEHAGNTGVGEASLAAIDGDDMAFPGTIHGRGLFVGDDADFIASVTIDAGEPCVRAEAVRGIRGVDVKQPSTIGRRVKPAETGKLVAVEAVVFVLRQANLRSK